VQPFEVELLNVIDETLCYCLGSTNVQILYNYMERKGCPKQEIPQKLNLFVEILENLVGTGRGQILGAAPIMENAILKELCKKLEVKYDEIGPGYFPEQCKKLEAVYFRTKRSGHSQKP
jgi:hypothetical protein